MLVLSRRIGESIKIGDNITVKVVSLMCGKTKIAIDAPKHIDVHRGEIYKKIHTDLRPLVADDMG